jgi:ketosteroid isomerase-like protein
VTSNAERADTLVRALRAGVARDRQTIEAVYTDDVKAWAPALSASSLTELMREFDLRDDAFSDIDIEVTPLDVSGDYACAEWRVSMTHTNPMKFRGGVADETGLRIRVNGVTVAEFRDDRICSFRQYWDELSVFEQLGLLDDGA